VAEPRSVVMGCDSHKLTVACGVVDQVGQEVAAAAFGNDSAGFGRVLEWLQMLDVAVIRVGIEGSANYGRHLATFLSAQGIDVREVPPIRTAQQRKRRRRPKTDRDDAIAIAKEVLADDRLPKAKPAMEVSDVQAELAVISDRRRSLVRRRQRLLNEVEMLLVKLPTVILEQIHGRTIAGRLRTLCRLDLDDANLSPADAQLVDWLTEMAQDLGCWETKIREFKRTLSELIAACGTTLTEDVGIGVVSAAELIAAVGDPARFRSEGAFARWCGVAPVAVSSGEGDGPPTRHRLDRLGNREVNRILYTMSVTQARYFAPGQQFLARKRAEGKTAKEARRAHMRQLANRVIRRMWADQRRQRTAQASTEAISLAVA
jgi:transposase